MFRPCAPLCLRASVVELSGVVEINGTAQSVDASSWICLQGAELGGLRPLAEGAGQSTALVDSMPDSSRVRVFRPPSNLVQEVLVRTLKTDPRMPAKETSTQVDGSGTLEVSSRRLPWASPKVRRISFGTPVPPKTLSPSNTSEPSMMDRSVAPTLNSPEPNAELMAASPLAFSSN